jgi:hypothetical protein
VAAITFYDILSSPEKPRGEALKTRLAALSILFILYGCAAAPRRAPSPETQPKASPASPNQSLASPALQKETLNIILFTDDALSNGMKCNDRRIVKKEVLGQTPAQGTPNSWTERWTLDRCGTMVRYRVDYTSGKKGKAYFIVKKEK